VDLIDSISNDAGKRDRRQILPRKKKDPAQSPGSYSQKHPESNGDDDAGDGDGDESQRWQEQLSQPEQQVRCQQEATCATS
jgi:hypothetical protein